MARCLVCGEYVGNDHYIRQWAPIVAFAPEGDVDVLNPKRTLQERIKRMRRMQEAAKREAERLRKEKEAK